MATRSLNKAMLIGNMTRDPELKYTPAGTAVCTFGLATNRSWTTESGEKKEEVEFHRIVVWNKLAELCSQLLFKGRRIYVEGRLQTRSWTGQDGVLHSMTEIVVSDMLILDNKREGEEGAETITAESVPAEQAATKEVETIKEETKEKETEKLKNPPSGEAGKKTEKPGKTEPEEDTTVNKEDIPF